MTGTDKNAPCPFCGGRVDPEGWLRGDGVRGPECESCGATAPTLGVWNSAKPAEQHQGEPVALPARKITNVLSYHATLGAEGWNACLDEIAKLGPLYTHADPGEVERDERAAFESWCAVIGYALKTSEHGNGFKPGYGSELFSAWKARAALERKS